MENAQTEPKNFVELSGEQPLNVQLIAESWMENTYPLPQWQLFGYLGYDMIGHVETLPNKNSDKLDIHDSVLMRLQW